MSEMEKTQVYKCYKTKKPPVIDGKLDESAWKKVGKSPRFIDCIGGNPALYDSRCALLWDDSYLYVAFWCEEPYPSANITKRDDLIWFENDIEVFIDGIDTYYELQVNAKNTIYEVFYIWKDAYTKGGYDKKNEFDILKNDAITFGGNHDRTGKYFWKGSHPRGNRWAFRNWDFPGLKTGVHIDGVLNDPSTVSKGWTVEMAFPWAGMQSLACGRSVPPKEGDCWRLFLGRYQKLFLNGQQTNVGWAWDRVGTDDNHRPERFTRIEFVDRYVEG